MCIRRKHRKTTRAGPYQLIGAVNCHAHAHPQSAGVRGSVMKVTRVSIGSSHVLAAYEYLIRRVQTIQLSKSLLSSRQSVGTSRCGTSPSLSHLATRIERYVYQCIPQPCFGLIMPGAVALWRHRLRVVPKANSFWGSPVPQLTSTSEIRSRCGRNRCEETIRCRRRLLTS